MVAGEMTTNGLSSLIGGFVSSSAAEIVSQKPTESVAAFNGGPIRVMWNRFDQPVSKPLVIPLSKIMAAVFAKGSFQCIPADQRSGD